MGVVLLSEEDLDIADYVTNFMNSRSEILGLKIKELIEEYFIKFVNWITTKGETTISCSKLALVKIGLSQMTRVTNKYGFIVAIINGLGQLLQADFRELFAQEVYDWLKEPPPPLILKSRHNVERDMIDSYVTNPNITVVNNFGKLPLVETGKISQCLDILKVWLDNKKDNHVLLIGAYGSAKSLIVKKLVENFDADILVFNCSGNTQPNYVKNKLSEYCISVNTNRGRQVGHKYLN
ncbi:hypothetical protein WA026_013969 [Henosepilachna vigintioctopunctata]|uniref:Cytoplasmic dynein 2 heavy chain 1 AAA+ ATPase domain-containing protein n=1 Tax=Henosepilachna vigintioctopunctata TaxID=420089 RepID=A0AAW1U122_9CUCU